MLVNMILFQATFVSLTGLRFGDRALHDSDFPLARLRLPNDAAMITLGNLSLAFGMVIVIAGISSYIGVRRVLRIEPFDIFRG